MRCVGIIARIDASCRVALTSPLTEAVWSLDASRSVRKICACFINKAAFGVAPLLFLAPLVQRCRQSTAAVGFEQHADQPELRADLPSSAVEEEMQEDSGILSLLSSPLPVGEEEPPLRPDVWRHNHEYSGAVLVSEGKINTRVGFW